MKKNNLLVLSATFLAALLSSCNSNIDSSNYESNSEISTSNSNSDSGHVEDNKPNLDYKLEENETYEKISVKTNTLNSLTYNTYSIDKISNLVVDPYSVTYFYDESTVRYPDAKLLQGQTILYTSAWYSRNTFERSDSCIEYVLYNDDGTWIVDDINNGSGTFIPFNGAVLSIPSTSSVKYNFNDEIKFTKGSIPTYDVGFYNQDGMRLAVRATNKLTWNNGCINLIDNNYLSKVTNTAWQRIGTMNCYYDESKQEFVVDKFRLQDKQRKIYTNVNNGFMLGATLEAGNENMTIVEGVRFNLNDRLKVEENAGLYNLSYDFDLANVNTYTLDSGSTISFKVSKQTTYDPTSKWEFEVGVDSNNMIVSTGSTVSIPTGGYKLTLRAANGSNGESLNSLLENIFTRASRVNISGNKLNINSSSGQRIDNFYRLTATYLEDIKDDVEVSNYSYDVDAIDEVEANLVNIREKMNKIVLPCDPTLEFRLYNLMGDVNQQYYKLLSATNRNEAVEVKTVWYISDFANNDRNLETIQKNLDNIRASGINEIIVGAIDKGTAYYSNSSVFNTHGSLTGKSYGEYGDNFLKAITEEAHKRNMKVFGLITPFSSIEGAWPELNNAYALSINGATSVTTSQGQVKMLDPASPVVQEKNEIAINDILTSNPDLDGIHLDYIRYGADNDNINTMTGVTEAARIKFNQYSKDKGLSYNVNTLDDLRNLLRTNRSAFASFNEFQQTLVTNTVKYIKEVCKKYDVPLTCAIADNYNYVKTWKCQDWAAWAKLGYVDALYLMDYYFDEHWINYYFEDMLNATENSTLLVTGIDPSYANLIPEYYARTIKGGVMNINSAGYGIFGTHTQNAKKDGWDLIADSNWIDSISPYDSLSAIMKASGDMLLTRCDKIYIKYNNQTANQKTALTQDLDALYQLIKGDDVASCNAVIEKLNAMIKTTYANNRADTRIKEQLKYMLKLANTKLNIVKD